MSNLKGKLEGVDALREFLPGKKYFIGIDSDGCAFDTMEIKHKECFCPAYINHFDLQAVSKYARETWEFVNLYSRTRGVNRFIALMHSLNILSEREEVAQRGAKIPELKSLKEWVEKETKLGNPALKKAAEESKDPELERLLKWSEDVNDSVKKIVRNLAPFPYVKESLEKIQDTADAIVVSQTPVEALTREWNENSITPYVRLIAGQEMGTKTEHISLAAGGKYENEKILMVGDAPGDLKAAKNNNALFFPIIPGREEESWKQFYSEGIDRFFHGTYKGEYEASLIEEFFGSLPEHPPWSKR